MKKIAVRIGIVVLVLLVLGFVAVALFLDGAVKRGVETIGPRLIQVEVKLQKVSLSLLSGSGTLKGLSVGNPSGFKSPSAIEVGTASLALVPGSLFSDKVIVKSINIQGPEITFETDLKGNNLSKILANLEAATGGGNKPTTPPPEAKPGKNLEVDDLKISGGKIHVSVTVLGGRSATVALPEIHLQDLGKNAEGITSAELAHKVLQVVLEQATTAAASAATDLARGALDFTKGLPQTGVSNADKITKGLGDLLKPKK